MKNSIHVNTIKDLIAKLGFDDTNNYLRDQLSVISKDVTNTREEIHSIMESIESEDNSDEKLHLQYRLQETKDILNDLLEKLKATDEMYINFKSYIKNINQ